jgi:Mg2+ and Co2+ transporter CorA
VVRCQETAALLSKELNLPMITDDRLHELDFGEFADKSTKGFDHWFDENKATFTTKISGGESLLDAKKRFGDFWYDINAQQQQEKILVITHSIGFEAFTQVVEALETEDEEEEDVELENKALIKSIRTKFASKFTQIETAVSTLSDLFKPASLKAINDEIKEWEKLKTAFEKKYEAAKAKANVNQQQLDQIQALEKRIAILKKQQ